MSSLAELLLGAQPAQQTQPVPAAEPSVPDGSGQFGMAELLERMRATQPEAASVVATHEAAEPAAVETAEDKAERTVPHHAQFQPREAGKFTGPPDREALDAAISAAMGTAGQ